MKNKEEQRELRQKKTKKKTTLNKYKLPIRWPRELLVLDGRFGGRSFFKLAYGNSNNEKALGKACFCLH